MLARISRGLDPSKLPHLSQVCCGSRPSPRQRGVIRECNLTRRSLVGLRRSLARTVLVCGIGIAPLAGSAQVSLEPAPAPTVTAEGESWFQARDPIVFAGIVYYMAGAQVHFNRYEMVRSGYYGGIPLYTRTTLEPYSVVFVPVSGGMMQPYERRRAGELAGTVGSTTPSFPGVSTAASAASGDVAAVPQAPGPPTGFAATNPPPMPTTAGAGSEESVEPVGTSGLNRSAPGRETTLVSAARPEGLNAIYVEYDGRRWFSDGPAVPLDQMRLKQIGQHHGVPVYAASSSEDTIYIAVAESAGDVVTPYSARPRSDR